MTFDIHRVLLVLLCLTLSLVASGQDIQFSNSKVKLDDLINEVESSTSFSFTYNPNLLSNAPLIDIEKRNIELDDLLSLLNTYYPYDTYLDKRNNKIILSSAGSYHIRGIVMDSLSGERLPYVTVFTQNGQVAKTNDEGIFRIKVTDDTYFSLSYMGAATRQIDVREVNPRNAVIQLFTDNIITVIIRDSAAIETTRINPDPKANPRDVRQALNMGGSGDLFSYLRTKPSVSKGSEGQNGLSIRGGAHDQNLILMDNIPVYEANHLGGLSSIFITDAIKDIGFYDSRFPSEYGGKLSSVVDVQLKEGNSYNHKRSARLGIEGLQLHQDGPISDKTTYNLNGKVSLFGAIVDRILRDNLNLIDPNFQYYDVYGKLSHRFSSKSKLTFSTYVGYDEIRLSNNQTDNLNIQDFNSIDWGNRMHSLQFTSLLSDKLFLRSTIGYSNYGYNSQGSYQISIPGEPEENFERFTILSKTDLEDQIFKSNLEYYKDSNGSILFGGQIVRHKNLASIQEEDTFNKEPIANGIVDSLYSSTEISLFLEDKSYFSPEFWTEIGVRYNAFLIGDQTYQNFNPRVSLNYLKDNTHVSLSYARLNQFIHLLSNPGPGLASDLWVPSTSSIAPQLVSSISLDIDIKVLKSQFGFSAYWKTFDNLIEYENPFDIIYSYVIDRRRYNIETDNRSWEERVSTGTGTAVGGETYFNYSGNRFDFEVAYAYARARRKFESIDDGQPFSFRYDRPHNVNTSLRYKFTRQAYIGAFFAFASGNAYTRAEDSFQTPDGGIVNTPKSRNNVRAQHFTHLDIDFEKTVTYSNGTQLTYSLGIYNVLNRKNPFYEFIEDGTIGEGPKLKKISLYPRFPRFNVSYRW